MTPATPARPPAGWLALGVVAQLAFAASVPFLYGFVLRWASRPPAGPAPALGWWTAALVDVLLIAGFAVPHSVLLAPRVRRALTARIPRALYGSIFTLASVTSLAALIGLWRPLPGLVWSATGPAAAALVVANAIAWALFVWTMSLGGLGNQTGLTPLVQAFRGRSEPRRGFAPRGPYRLLRHPMYGAFLLVVWLTPTMSTAHLVLSVGLTAYLLVGSVLKDRRMLGAVGEPYARYMAEVRGFPLVPFGPLGRVAPRDPHLVGA